jgi:hypothetical protein
VTVFCGLHAHRCRTLFLSNLFVIAAAQPVILIDTEADVVSVSESLRSYPETLYDERAESAQEITEM